MGILPDNTFEVKEWPGETSLQNCPSIETPIHHHTHLQRSQL